LKCGSKLNFEDAVPIWPWKSKSSPKVQLIEEFEPPTERVF
jgi:hypothetical protein